MGYPGYIITITTVYVVHFPRSCVTVMTYHSICIEFLSLANRTDHTIDRISAKNTFKLMICLHNLKTPSLHFVYSIYALFHVLFFFVPRLGYSFCANITNRTFRAGHVVHNLRAVRAIGAVGAAASVRATRAYVAVHAILSVFCPHTLEIDGAFNFALSSLVVYYISDAIAVRHSLAYCIVRVVLSALAVQVLGIGRATLALSA